MTIRVLLADNHRLMRDTVRALLELDGGIAVVAEAGDGMTALGLAAQTRPDIVIMDINMQGLNGIEVTKQLLSRYPEIKIIALTAHGDRHLVQGMLEAGASGYVIKAAAGDELLPAIDAALHGRTYLCSEINALADSRQIAMTC